MFKCFGGFSAIETSKISMLTITTGFFNSLHSRLVDQSLIRGVLGDVAMAILAIDCLYIQQLFREGQQAEKQQQHRQKDGRTTQPDDVSLSLP